MVLIILLVYYLEAKVVHLLMHACKCYSVPCYCQLLTEIFAQAIRGLIIFYTHVSSVYLQG